MLISTVAARTGASSVAGKGNATGDCALGDSPLPKFSWHPLPRFYSSDDALLLTLIQPKNGRIAGRTVRERDRLNAQRFLTSPKLVYFDADLPRRSGFFFIPSWCRKLCRMIKFIFVVPTSVLARRLFGYCASSNNSATAEPDVGCIINPYLCSKSRRCPIDIVEPEILIQSIKWG